MLYIISKSVYPRKRNPVWSFTIFHHRTPNDTAKRPKISTRNKFDNIATPMRPTKSSSRNDS